MGEDPSKNVTPAFEDTGLGRVGVDRVVLEFPVGRLLRTSEAVYGPTEGVDAWEKATCLRTERWEPERPTMLFVGLWLAEEGVNDSKSCCS